MKSNLSVNKSFATRAQSFSGCDGGNPYGSIWFCGIEPASEKKPNFKLALKTVPFISDMIIRDNFLKFQYNRGVLKLYSLILGESLADCRKVFQKHNVFDKDSDSFKLNLYPVAFKNLKSSMTDDLKSGSGFANKKEYLEWCQAHRFPIIKQWLDAYKPEIIICTGVKKAILFKKAFLGEDFTRFPNGKQIISSREMQWVKDTINNTIIFIIPSLGKSGLVKNNDIKAFGEAIADIYINIPKKQYFS